MKNDDVIQFCEDAAKDALMMVCRPLLMDGTGRYYAKNGNPMSPAEVMKEHEMMRSALEKIKDRLAHVPRAAAI